MNASMLLDENASRTAQAELRHVITELPVLVILPHNRCNCRCMMCDIWKIRQTREITARDLQPHLNSLRTLKVRWIVFSGGEPLLHSGLPALSSILRKEGIRLTVLTAGLLLERKAQLVAEHFDDLIVSLDGPPDIHNRIRGVSNAFERLSSGVAAVRALMPRIAIQGRCTVQKANHVFLRETVLSARGIGLSSVSFLAADVVGEAFNRPGGWFPSQQGPVALDNQGIEELDSEIESLIAEFSGDIHSGFIVETANKLRRIPYHFQAHHGTVQPLAPRCNAPWVSAVIEADGAVRPCFFHPAIGNIQDGALSEVINSEQAMQFRQDLDVATNSICRRCVCSIYIPNATNNQY
jgi:MoaA/NifB/PqqE/SkfB family radical SAM enzyme